MNKSSEIAWLPFTFLLPKPQRKLNLTYNENLITFLHSA